MSLLLKALKQAEADDRAGMDKAGVAGRRDPDFELEPVAPVGSAQAREWVEPPGLLFGSGDAAPPAASPASGFRWPQLSLVPAVALFAVLIALGYGVYLYFALQPPAPLPTPASASVPLPPSVAEPAPQAAAPLPAPPASPAAMPPALPIAAAPVRPQSQPATPADPTRRALDKPRAEAPAMPLPAFQPDTTVTLLARAYAAYQRGALDEAQRLYAQAGERNVDALLGLAAIASVRNDDAEAQRRYRQVLDLDPRNAVAQGALLDLLGNTDAQAAESRLKMLIEREPSAQLYQSLGTLYADQARWSEAQAAYFEAYRGAPDNADFAFNLAVSLDQLRQYSAALTYYQKALATEGAHRFDRAQAEARIRELQALR